eukprot:TRINITY_DN793_c0_g1_i1.p1 TRINITY_DN793_c0_g1~~TRINITY_DN793_c0_g1_i1.p1  ORF type:complete len:224 (-),score=51.25 TRINITY_DN793_c0_g1_i1:103-714(-)
MPGTKTKQKNNLPLLAPRTHPARTIQSTLTMGGPTSVEDFVVSSCDFMDDRLFGSSDGEAMVLCLCALVLWALTLVLLIGLWRTCMILAGKADQLEPGVKHGTPMYWRLNRAHANACENLPISATIFFAVYLLNLSSPFFTRLAMIVVVARIGQSFFHILSGSMPSMTVRFVFFATQCVAHTLACVVVFEKKYHVVQAVMDLF